MSWVITGAEKTPVDLYRSNVSLLLHGNADGSGNILDSSPSPKTVSKFGNAASATPPSYPNSNSAFGNAIALDGNGDYLTVPYAQDWNLAADNFTIEAWIRTSDTSTAYPSFVGRWQGATAANWDFRHRSIDVGNVVVFVYSLNGTSPVVVQTNVSVTDGEWHHVAACRSGSNLRLFVDGIVSATASIGNSVIFNNISVPLYVGYDPYGASYFNGYIDDLRITKGVARYTSNFTPPTAPFPDI